MKQLTLIIITIFVSIISSGCGKKNTSIALPSNVSNENITKNMKLTSPVFNYRDFIPAKYTCDGDDVNPLLEISNVPTSVKSLVLIVDDPDAPGGDWVHWTIWNIAPDTKIISENSAPTGAVQGMTDFGSNKYGGPCPPSGIHHYQFKLYALDILLSLNPSAIKKDIEKAMENHILDQTILIGLYKKSKDFKI